MLIKNKLLGLLISIVLLAACNRPTPTAKQIPADTATAQPTIKETENTLLETQSISPSNTPSTTSTPTEPAPPEQFPTESIPTLDLGKAIKHFSKDQEITLLTIKMINNKQGWGIAVADTETEHILQTNDGGKTWLDVTPPQPANNGGLPLKADGLFWDQKSAYVAYQGSKLVWSTADGGSTWSYSPLSYKTLSGALFAAHDSRYVWLFQFLDAGMQKVYTAVYRSLDNGQNWNLLFDPTGDITIQSFDKTGAQFANQKYGWLTRDFRGVQPIVQLDITTDGGENWQPVQVPAPPAAPTIFQDCACGLYDPLLIEQGKGTFRLACKCFENDQLIYRNFLYRTNNLGANWLVLPIPNGDLITISDQVLYSIGRKINRSNDGGVSWTDVKTVYWDGQFSFINPDVAWAVAYDPEDEEYALVKTNDGCATFFEIEPVLQ